MGAIGTFAARVRRAVLLALTASCACALGCSANRSGIRDANPPPAVHNQATGGSTGGTGVASTAQGSAGAPTHDTGAAGNGGSSAPPPAATPPSAAAPPPTPTTVAKPNANLDPNLTFDWPETPPGGGGSNCQPGTYTGTFDCTFSDPSGLIPDIELTGPVSLTFSQSMDGEFLEISQGDFQAVANDVIGAQAKIVGKLDCNSLMLVAMAMDGMWSIGDPNDPVIPGGGLEGDITGTLDPATGTLSGQWNFGDPNVGACPGTWSVMRTP
jgi:hypothetical protein